MLLHSSEPSPAGGSAALPPAPTPDEQLRVRELSLLYGEQCAEAPVSQQELRALERNVRQVPAVTAHLLQELSQDRASEAQRAACSIYAAGSQDCLTDIAGSSNKRV